VYLTYLAKGVLIDGPNGIKYKLERILKMAKSSAPRPPNGPSTTGGVSGKGRGNNPPKGK